MTETNSSKTYVKNVSLASSRDNSDSKSNSDVKVVPQNELQPMNPKPKGPKHVREGYSFAVPVEFGTEVPNSDNCCELWEEIEPSSPNESIMK